jgi:DNA-binding Xre family transcriptional regulator
MNDECLEFTEQTFYGSFYNDLKHARALVLIQSPYLGIERMANARPVLRECIRRNVRVCVFVRRPKGWHNREFDPRMKSMEVLMHQLESDGVHVTMKQAAHEKYVVIDGNILYRGTLNPLSQIDSSEEMFRYMNPQLALKVVMEKGLDKCAKCIENGVNILDTNDLRIQAGRAIKEARMDRNMSQAELGALTGLDQRSISQIESGGRNLTLSKLDLICQELHMAPMYVPWFLKPIFHHGLSSFKPKPPIQ